MNKKATIINLSLKENTLIGTGGIPETGIFITVILFIMLIYLFISLKYINRSKYEDKGSVI